MRKNGHLSSTYTLIFLGSYKEHAVASIWKFIEFDGKPLGQSIDWYIKGLGLVRSESGLIENGHFTLGGKQILTSPAIPFDIADLPIVVPEAKENNASPEKLVMEPESAKNAIPAPSESPAPSNEAAESASADGIIKRPSRYNNGTFEYYSDRLIPILYDVPKGIVKQMPSEQLAIIQRTEQFGEEAYRLAAQQGENPVLKQRLKETTNKKARTLIVVDGTKAVFSGRKVHIGEFVDGTKRFGGLGRNLVSIHGWVGKIKLEANVAKISIGLRSIRNDKDYQPPRTTYVTDFVPFITITIETDHLSDAGVAQFGNFKDGDWVKVDMQAINWSGQQTVGFDDRWSSKPLKPIYGGLDVKEIESDLRGRTGQFPEPKVTKVLVGSEDAPFAAAAPAVASQQAVRPSATTPGTSQATITEPKEHTSEFRTWTNSTGTSKIEAVFAGMELGKVKLTKKNGKKIQLPLEKLSSDDQEWIKHRVAQPVDDNPPSKGPLGGKWQASAGAEFQIDDDGATVTVKLISSGFLQEFSGKLARGEKGTASKVLTGTLDAVFSPDAPKRYAILVRAAIADQDHLRISCSDWPVWNNRGKKIGTKTLSETWMRQQ